MALSQVPLPQQNINVPVIRSLPLDKNLKRYFLRKFDTMVRNNGPVYACAVFARLRETLLGYLADYNRIANAEAWLRRSGVKVNGWLRKLFHYCETAPESALEFVKLYCGPNDPIVTVDAAAESQHRTLINASEVNDTPPQFLVEWLELIGRTKLPSVSDLMKVRSSFARHPWEGVKVFKRVGKRSHWAVPSFLAKALTHHEPQQVRDYLSKWKRLTAVKPASAESIARQVAAYTPRADMYVDYGRGPVNLKASLSYEKDCWNFGQMQEYLDLEKEEGGNGLTSTDYDFILDLLDPVCVGELMDPEFPWGCQRSFTDGRYVGQIHHIPKTGTVKRRSIAAPNRFVQMGMSIADLSLSSVLKKLGKARDCTYNQSRLDTYIANRVNNDALYAGSVDLHQATDYLPFSWMQEIWRLIFRGRVTEMEEQSWRLFVHASRGAWYNEGFLDRWTVGQPLGAVPSFRCLGLTHNLLVEALAFANGLLHSPYAVLGDDIVIMNKKLRKQYIVLMKNAGIPLSLHKSYEGRLVEFAGKFFFKNHAPFYNTDQRALTWNSLYDFQWATGVNIPFHHLPTKLRKKVQKIVREVGLPKDTSKTVYEIARTYGATSRGSYVPWTGNPLLWEFWPDLVLRLDDEDKENVERRLTTGIQATASGHPICYASRRYAEKDGFFLQYRSMVPLWFRDKYRPVATDNVITAAALLLAERVAANQTDHQ